MFNTYKIKFDFSFTKKLENKECLLLRSQNYNKEIIDFIILCVTKTKC